MQMFGVVTTQTMGLSREPSLRSSPILLGLRPVCVCCRLRSHVTLVSNQQSVTCSSLCSPLMLSRLVTKITRRKADRVEKSDERVTNWAFGYIKPLAHQCQQRQRLPLGDGSNGSIFILARTLCNSRAEGSQRHCSGLFLQRLEHTLPTGL